MRKVMIRVYLLSLTLSSASAALAAPPTIREQRIQYLSALAGLPIEFRADILLSALEAHKELLTSPQIQTDLRELYESASQASRPFPQRFAITSNVDHVESMLATAEHNQPLDALDIRIRVLKLMALREPLSAYSPIWSIQTSWPPETCSSALVYTAQPYDDFLRAEIPVWLNSHAADPRQIEHDLSGQIARMSTVSSLSQLAALLSSVPMDNDSLRLLTTQYINQEARVAVPDRELGSAISLEELLENTDKLAVRMQAADEATYPLFAALRNTLISGTRSRCNDSISHPTNTLKAFNDLLAKHHLSTGDLVLPEHALDGVKNGGNAVLNQIDPSGADDQTIKILSRYAARSDKEPMVDEIGDWNAASASLLSSLENQSHQEKCVLCDFYATSLKYFLLADYSADKPFSTAKEQALRGYIRFLITARSTDVDTVAWLSQLKIILNYARQPDAEAKARIESLKTRGFHLMGLPTPSAKVIIDEMHESTDKIARTYAMYESLFHPSYNSPY